MNLGENICRLRTAKNMSQGDLADALEVSRQSVSKWETGASTPELDKLLRLSEIFEISLDELVRGESAPSAEPAPVQPAPAGKQEPPLRQTVGIVLLAAGLVTGVVLFLLSSDPFALLCGAPLAFCGLICLAAKRHPALLCFWAFYGIIYAYIRFATGIRWWWVLCSWLYREELRTHAMIAWGFVLALAALLAATVWTLRRSFQK